MRHSTISSTFDNIINNFVKEHGKKPKFIVLSMPAWIEASYEVGKDRGLLEDEASLNDLDQYRGITVAVTHRKNTPDIEVG